MATKNSEVIFNTPLRLVADYHQPFDYRSVPDLTRDELDPYMFPLAGRTIGVLRLFAEGEVESAYSWDIDVSGIDSESASCMAATASCCTASAANPFPTEHASGP